jgi:hypothetical protein
MTSRERMAAAMRHEQPDRVPVMCQLALGHYFLNTDLDEIDIWHDTAAFGDALIELQRRYGFDGILVNLPGRDPDWRNQVRRIERVGEDRHIIWKNDLVTIVPPTTIRTCTSRTGRPAISRRSRDRAGPAVLHRAARPVRHHVPVQLGLRQ